MDLFGGRPNDSTSSPFDAIRFVGEEGEWWSARDLMSLLGYDSWRRFEDTVERARAACTNSGQDEPDHFADTVKVIRAGRWGEQNVSDVRLTRYACYLLAQNGDPRKPEIARAQTYFAVKTREAEVSAVVPTQLPSNFAEALRAYADQVERTEAEALARAAAEHQVAELEPLASSWRRLADAEGTMSVSDAAKELANVPGVRTGQKRLFATMQGFGMVFRGPDSAWLAYQAQVNLGRLTERVSSYVDSNTGERIIGAPTVRITVKGLEYLHRRLSAGTDVVNAS